MRTAALWLFPTMYVGQCPKLAAIPVHRQVCHSPVTLPASACRLQPFGCLLLCVRRSPWGQQPTEAVLEQQLHGTGTWQDLHTMAAKADIIAMTCSQTPETKGMVDSKLLAACKPGVRIVNVARGRPSDLVWACCCCLCTSALHSRRGCSAAVEWLVRLRSSHKCCMSSWLPQPYA